ncbi:hypothetical protein BGX26_009601 [Mortierella sp. AD094]|nr:hypothetical protein BGX26_009601 [Mortierella sp. AD094]
MLPPFSTDIAAAAYRQGERPRAVSKKRGLKEMSNKEAKGLLEEVCMKMMQIKIASALKPILCKTKFKAGETRESLIEKAHADTKAAFKNLTKVPKKTLETTVDLIRERHGVGGDFRRVDLQKHLGACRGNIKYWRSAVESKYEQVWNKVLECDKRVKAIKRQKIETDFAPNASKVVVSQAEGESQADSHASENSDEDKDKDRDKTLRTSDDCQGDISDVMDELSALTLKTTMAIAAGALYNDGQAPRTLNVRNLLPIGFEFCDNVSHVIDVAPIPQNLQDHLARCIDTKTTSRDDISSLLSQNHLQHLHTEFLVQRQAKRREAVDQSLAVFIRQPTDHVLPSSPEGLSHTIVENIRQYATAVNNLWQGSIFRKSLEYTLRILLRLHLAPKREQQSMERAKITARSKSEKSSGKASMTRKQWKFRVKELCDELSDLLSGKHNGKNGTRAPNRLNAIVAKLRLLQTIEPIAKEFRIPPLERQLELIANAHSVSNTESPLPSSNDTGTQVSVLLDEVADLDDDISEDENDIDNQPDTEGTSEKEPTRARLRALQAITKMLVESPHVCEPVNASYVKKCAFKNDDITPRECEVVAKIVRELRPYVPKRRPNPDGPGMKESLPHVALRAPLVLIANTLLRDAGYYIYTRRMTPKISTGSLHGLALGSTGIYEVFCSREPGHFDINDANGSPLSDAESAVSPLDNKRAVFGAFFNMKYIEQVCHAHGLKFADRITFVDRFTIKLMGEVISHGVERQGHPIAYNYDEKRKRKKYKPPDLKWLNKFKESGLSWLDVARRAETAAVAVKHEESLVNHLQRKLRKREESQSAASLSVKRNEQGAYNELQAARQAVRAVRKIFISCDVALRKSRQMCYYWNKLLKAAGSERSSTTGGGLREAESSSSALAASSSGAQRRYTRPTWSRPAVTDSVENIDMTQYGVTAWNNRLLSFGGTDYGVRIMNQTIAQNHGEIMTHINRYHVLSGN